MRNFLIALCVFVAGFLAAIGWLRPYVPFFSLYTDGVSERQESREIRYAVWDAPQSIGQPTNSSDNEVRPSLSYAGDWMFYEVGEVGANADIWMAPIVEGVAQPGRPAPFNSGDDDVSPYCDDGRYVYFASNRNGGRGGFDIFRAPLNQDGVGDAEAVTGNVNTIANEIDPAIRPGTLELYFASDRGKRRPNYDLYRAVATTDGYHVSEPLAILNSSSDEREPGFAPDGMVVFFASNRDGGLGGFDLWRSLEDHGKLLAPENVTALNSSGDDRSPCPAAEGFSLLFASNRGAANLDIYRATTHELFKRQLRPLGVSDFTYVALLLLAALLAYLARHFQTLDFLAKCILLSLLLHLAFMLWMQRVEVKTEITERPEGPRTFKVRFEDGAGTISEAGGGGWHQSFREQQIAALGAAVERAETGLPGEARSAEQVALALDREAPSYVGERHQSSVGPQSTSSVMSSVPSSVTFTEDRPLAHADAPDLKIGAVGLAAGRASAGASRAATAAPTGKDSAAAAPVARTERPEESGRSAGTVTHEASAVPSLAASKTAGVAVAAPHESPAVLGGESKTFAPSPTAVSARSASGPVGRAALTTDAAIAPRDGSVIARASETEDLGGDARSAPGIGGAGINRPGLDRPDGGRAGTAVDVAVNAPPAEPKPIGATDAGGGGGAVGLALAPKDVGHGVRSVAPQRAAVGSDSGGFPGVGVEQAAVPLAHESSPEPARASGARSLERTVESTQVSASLPAITETLPLRATAGAGEGGTGVGGAVGTPLAARNLAGRSTVAAVERFRPNLVAEPIPEPSKIAIAAREEIEQPATTPPTRDLGVYSRRFGEEKKIAIQTYGGSEATERAVTLGLQYLAAIQNRDGHWGSSDDDDEKYGQVMVGKTALCLLAFLGAGHTPQSATKYSDSAARAVKFLLSVQDDRTGHFGFTSAYSHGTATYALAECYAITRAAELREPLERAIDHILSEQHENRRDRKDHGGWGYFYPNGRVFDKWPRASITSWQVMALKSARLGGLDIPEPAFRDAQSFLLNCWDERIGAFRYNHDPSRLRSSYATLPGSTPAALFALSLLGEVDPQEPAIAGGFEFIRERKPHEFAYRGEAAFVQDAAGNPYFWYYATLATFVRGGRDWDEWNAALKATLLPAQQRDGSWQPICLYARYAGDDANDRSYTTSLCVLMLEVYYRYFTPLLRATSK